LKDNRRYVKEQTMRKSYVKLWYLKLMVSLIVVGLPQMALTQEKPEKPDQPEKPAMMEQKAAEVQVVRDAVAAGISDREPVEPGKMFSPGLERIYYFTEVQSDDPNTEITHVWYYGDREMARVTLPVDGSRWRTWSSKQILPEWTGQWMVEAVTADGTVVATQAFNVELGPTGEPHPASEPEPGPARESTSMTEPDKK
jgi:hypothetical protein